MKDHNMRDTQKDIVTASTHNNIEKVLYRMKKMACKILTFVNMILTQYYKNHC